MTDKWARCNFDGRPIHPGGRAIIDTFALWLQMDDDERREAVRLDPQWRAFVIGNFTPFRSPSFGHP